VVALVAGITAGATGAIAGAVVVLARHSIIDFTTALIALVTFGITWLRWKVPEPVIVLAAALAGLAIRG
jgi:chromate transporter